MADIPRAVLSEHLQEWMEGSVLKAAVFLTFRFDPGFFEQEVLPVFLDVPLSHEPAVRLVQLEDALHRVDHLAVYYDRGGLEAGATGAKLDVRRIPIAWPTGYFHPKNVVLLVEGVGEEDAKKDGPPEQRLLVGTLSANLTEAGWWRNVECCHVEELRLGEKSVLAEDMLRLFTRLRRACAAQEHAALDALEAFVRRVPERVHATSEGQLLTRLYVGAPDGRGAGQSVPEFLDEVGGRRLVGLNLEVISPYFDNGSDAKPLRDLIATFSPTEVRVLLPRAADGTALCKGPFYEAVRRLPETRWGKLPEDVVRSAPAKDAAPRTVHAKVYRFFSARSPKYEALFVGSVNLTNAAHSKGGNFETGFLIERDLERGTAPDWWLSVDGAKPDAFRETAEDEGLGQGPGVALAIRYTWDRAEGSAFWDRADRSPLLDVSAQGSRLFSLGPLRPREWIALTPEQGAALRGVLPSTSFLTVAVEGEDPAVILVQEEGMAHKPSILLSLSVADILRCWALLTPEQRAAVIEGHVPQANTSGLAVTLPPAKDAPASIFDAFAGIFHAFGCLERGVLKALAEGREKEAVYLVFGQKYDSLPRLLERVLKEEQKELDQVRRYVILLCARQLLDRVRSEASEEFRGAHRRDFDALYARLQTVGEVRDSFRFGEEKERQQFLAWFERWFLKRAEPAPAAKP